MPLHVIYVRGNNLNGIDLTYKKNNRSCWIQRQIIGLIDHTTYMCYVVQTIQYLMPII